MQHVHTFANNSDKIRCLDSVKSSKVLIAGCAQVEVFDIEKKTKVQTSSSGRSQGSVYSLLVHEASLHTVLCGRHDGTLQVFDLRTDMKPVSERKEHTNTIRSFGVIGDASSSNIIATGSYDLTVKLWDLRTLQPVASDSSLTKFKHSGYVNGVWHDTTNQFLYTASQSGLTAFKCSDAKKNVFTHDTATTRIDKNGHKDEVLSIGYYEDNNSGSRVLVTASKDTTLKVYDLNLHKSVNTLFGHSSGVTCVQVDQYNERAFSTGADGMLLQWSLSGYYNEDSVQAHDEPIRALTMVKKSDASDSTIIATGAQDSAVKIWSVSS